MKQLNLYVLNDLKLFTWCFLFLEDLKVCSLIMCLIHKQHPINYNHSLLSKVFELKCLLKLLKVHLSIQNRLPKMLRHLILQLHFHRLKGFTIVSKILVLRLKMVKFRKALEHIKRLFFLHKDLNLLELFSRDHTNTQ